MALDPNAPPAEPAAVSAIENEIPAYRAIEPLAVMGLVLGLLSILCFANLYFLIVAAAAIVVGVVADRKIRRLSDVLTGRGLAQAAIALGLSCGLAATTVEMIQTYFRGREATAFAREFAGVLKGGSLAQAVALKNPPAFREGKTPEDLLAEMKKGAQPMMADELTRSLDEIRSRLARPGASVTVEGLETNALDGLDPYATARLRIEAPDEHGHRKTEYALLVLRGAKHQGRRGWYAEEVMFPYTPKTHVAREKPVDDGHGHAH